MGGLRYCFQSCMMGHAKLDMLLGMELDMSIICTGLARMLMKDKESKLTLHAEPCQECLHAHMHAAHHMISDMKVCIYCVDSGTLEQTCACHPWHALAVHSIGKAAEMLVKGYQNLFRNQIIHARLHEHLHG